MATVSPGEPRIRPLLTLNEVSVLADIPEEKIRDELDAGVVPRQRVRGARLVFRPRDVFFFRMTRDLPVELSPSDRKALHDFVVMRTSSAGPWRRTETGLELMGRIPTRFETQQVLRDTAQRLRSYWHGKRRVESRSDVLGGEPVFKGSRVSVRHVGDLIRNGVPPDELKEDFPKLSDEDFEFAALFTQLNQPPGRPRKRLEYRRQRHRSAG
jgi:uncharacterized protein (DUF433 family)